MSSAELPGVDVAIVSKRLGKKLGNVFYVAVGYIGLQKFICNLHRMPMSRFALLTFFILDTFFVVSVACG